MNLLPIFSKLERYEKGWGAEYWIVNNEKYCGKILQFKQDAEFSMHFHIQKEETWCVTEGKLLMRYFDLTNAEQCERILEKGDVVHLKPNIPHKLIALKESIVFEVSTQHFEEDSYRIQKGNSQK